MSHHRTAKGTLSGFKVHDHEWCCHCWDLFILSNQKMQNLV